MAVISGIININKPQGFTSSDVVVVAKGVLRRVFGEKNFKVGHLGTLDPLGTGVLPISVGQATKLFDYFQKTSKVYIAGLRLNETTDTLDGAGKLIATSSIQVTAEQVASVLEAFKGEILQIPPQYSALSVGGKRAYDIARSGGTVELAGRKVTIYNLELLHDNAILLKNINNISNENAENTQKTDFHLKIECSSGTYIRSLMRDIAEKLGGVGYMSYIKRIKTHSFDITGSVTLEDFKLEPLKFLTPIDEVLRDLPHYDFDDDENVKFRSGAVVIARKPDSDELNACCYGGKIIGLATIENGYIVSSVRLYDNKL